MSDKVFLDSNIIIYSYSSTEPAKQRITAKILSTHETVISTQVLNELTHIITKKFHFSYQQAKEVIIECCQNSQLQINSQQTILLACDVATKYKFSFFDSAIIAAALESHCNILYSEDMHPISNIEQRLTIVNPFKGTVGDAQG